MDEKATQDARLDYLVEEFKADSVQYPNRYVQRTHGQIITIALLYARMLQITVNPPFVGARMMNAAQKDDVLTIFGAKWQNVGNLDYVTCWYKKAADLMRETAIRAALVSTNSVTQGEAVANLWKLLMEGGVHIDFAHRTFRWNSEASIKAHVHCGIVGFSVVESDRQKVIFDNGTPINAQHINGYLIDAEDVLVESRKHPICDVPEIGIGN